MILTIPEGCFLKDLPLLCLRVMCLGGPSSKAPIAVASPATTRIILPPDALVLAFLARDTRRGAPGVGAGQERRRPHIHSASARTVAEAQALTASAGGGPAAGATEAPTEDRSWRSGPG
jgi:hypothetical protein